jgi:TRAP transporter TAXI family solute receptor
MKIIAMAMPVLALALSLASPGLAAQQNIVIGTGGTTGVYYTTGNAICRLVNKEQDKSGVDCSVKGSGGSVSNVGAIQSGKVNFGIVQSDVQYHAVKGLPHFRGRSPDDNLRAVFSVFLEALTVVARKDANIQKFEDFKGKRFNIGNPGAGTRETTMMLMSALGMKLSDFAQISELEPDEQGAALCDNRIDGFGYMVGNPAANIQEVMTACGGHLVSLSGPAVERLLKENPHIVQATIPGGMYWGNPDATKTFGVVASLVTSASVPDDIVYAVVAAVFDNLEEFKKQHPALSKLNADEMIRSGMSAPLHEGALRYYREKGWM